MKLTNAIKMYKAHVSYKKCYKLYKYFVYGTKILLFAQKNSNMVNWLNIFKSAFILMCLY